MMKMNYGAGAFAALASFLVGAAAARNAPVSYGHGQIPTRRKRRVRAAALKSSAKHKAKRKARRRRMRAA